MQQQNKAREQRRAAHALRMREKKASRERARFALDQHLEQTNTAVAELRDSLRAAVQRQRPHGSAAEIDAEVQTQLHEVMRATTAGGEFQTGEGKVFFATDLREVMREIAPDGRGVSLEKLHAGLLRRMRAGLRKHIPDADDSEIEELVAGESEKLRLNLMNIAAAERGINPAAACIDHDEATKAEGRERAERMKPKARELACGPALRHLTPTIIEALANNDAGLDDVHHVLVYPAPAGSPPGWHGDVDFGRPLPPIAGGIGTKVANPAKSPEDAETFAMDVLAGIAAFEIARADPYHRLCPREEIPLETYAFRDWPDALFIEFTATDGQPARMQFPARMVLQDKFLDSCREAALLPSGVPLGNYGARLWGLALEFAKWLDAAPERFEALKEAARERLAFERMDADHFTY